MASIVRSVMKKIISLLLIIVILISVGVFAWRRVNVFEYAKHVSPDGRFAIRVMEYPQVFGHMPGDSGSGSGCVELVDLKTNEVLESKYVDLVLSIERVRWSQHAVDVFQFAEWALPQSE